MNVLVTDKKKKQFTAEEIQDKHSISHSGTRPQKPKLWSGGIESDAASLEGRFSFQSKQTSSHIRLQTVREAKGGIEGSV